jgi:hypothetical protein
MRDRRMKMLMEAALEEIENEEKDDRVAAFESELNGYDGAD